MAKVKIILIWLIGITFAATGIMKFLNLDTMSAAIFGRANYPSWLFYVVATFELLGGVLLIINITRRIGAALIAVVMLGALWTHFNLKDDFTHYIAPIIIILFSVMVINSKHKGSV